MTALPEHEARPYSVNQLAQRWDCSPSMIRKLIKSNRLRPFRIGELIRISAAEVERYETCQDQPMTTNGPSSDLGEGSPSSGGSKTEPEPESDTGGSLISQDRESAKAEARAIWEGADDSPWTVARLMTAYLASIKDKPSHARRQDAWKAMRPFWEKVDPALVDEQMCRNYRQLRNVGDATARYELMQLSTALNWGVDETKIPKRGKTWLPAQPEHKTRHLTRQEFARWFAEVRAQHARTYVMLGLYTVARPSAILELTWDRVDFMRRLIDFTPPGRARTAKRRTVVTIGDTLLAELQRAHAARTCTHVVEHGGHPVQSIKKAFQAASERSGVHATPYTLRHTGAVWAAEGGVSMSELAQMMGHDDDRTTQKHYARYSPDHLRNVVDAIEGRARGSM